jgi:AcrR family transcriptional regulator
MPKWFSDSEKELIGKRLLEQGYRLFSTYGLRKTNVEELARAVGISKGAFYHFYDSKEALFMDVIEEVEVRMRQELLAMVDQPGPSPRARLFAMLKRAFNLFDEMPILRFVTGSDYDLLFRRLPAEKLQQHLASDQAFFLELIDRCQRAGIPIRAPVEQISGLLYQLVLSIFHEDDLGKTTFHGSADVLLELIAAFCVGDIELESQK